MATERENDASFLDRQKSRLFEYLGEKVIPENKRVLAAMRTVPRERFFPGDESYSNNDISLDIPGYEGVARIPEPTVVAMMLDRLKPERSDKVLEIGTGSGYQAAALSYLAGRVVTADFYPELVEDSKTRLENLGIENVDFVVADANTVFTADEVFDKAIVTTAVYPKPDLAFLPSIKIGGTCLVPVGGRNGYPQACTLAELKRTEDGFEIVDKLDGFSFVPMMGEAGWEGGKEAIAASFNEFFGLSKN